MTDDELPDQLPLFDSPASPMRRHQPAPRSSAAVYTRITGRRFCDDCCRDARRGPLGYLPPPKPAVWRRTDDTTETFLCQHHKDERHTHDIR